jgi:hypothetical protein
VGIQKSEPPNTDQVYFRLLNGCSSIRKLDKIIWMLNATHFNLKTIQNLDYLSCFRMVLSAILFFNHLKSGPVIKWSKLAWTVWYETDHNSNFIHSKMVLLNEPFKIWTKIVITEKPGILLSNHF